MRRVSRLPLAGVTVLLLVGTACTGGGAPRATGPAPADEPTASAPLVNPGASSSASASTKPVAIKTSGPPGPRYSSPTGTKTPKEIPQSRLPTVNLFSGKNNTVGFTKDQITLCAHAALTYADVFDTKPQDLNVYWSWVNARGGIYGRKVVETFEDDAYKPDQAVQAAEKCKAKDPFILLGGIGFDQIPAVRSWVETNKALYIHHIAPEDFKKQYSFSYLPSVDEVGALAGQYVRSHHKGRKIGVIWRQSENWEPGHKGFLLALKQAGITPVADVPVQNQQAVYTQQVQELKDKGAEVVFLWENALASTEIIKQAKGQQYSPIYLAFPFNLTTDTLGSDALNPPMEGIATWLPYVNGKFDGSFKRYANELKIFEEAQQTYGNAAKGNDILWMTWLANKQLHQLLLDCGPDCTRNKVASLLSSDVHKAVFPGCSIDFSDPANNIGSHAVNIFKTFNNAGAAAWEEIDDCKTRF